MPEVASQGFYKSFSCFWNAAWEDMILHTIIWIIHTPEVVLLVVVMTAQSTFTMLKPSLQKDVRNTVGGQLSPILIPVFGRRKKSVCDIVYTFCYTSTIDAGTNLLVFKRYKALLWGGFIFPKIATHYIGHPRPCRNFTYPSKLRQVSEVN